MAVRVRMRWEGVTPEQYDQVRETVGWERDRARGGVLHVAWFVGDQLNVCDIWDSADDFEAFVEQRLMPGVAKVGVPGKPEVQILPTYNWQLELPACDGAVVGEDEIPFEAYQALEAKVGWRERPPAGGIALIAAVDGPLVRAVSVFERPTDVEAFEGQRIGPAAIELGFPAEAVAPGALHRLHALFDSAGAGPQANQAAVERFLDALGRWDLDTAVGCLSPDFVHHFGGFPAQEGPSSWRHLATQFATAFPDMSLTVEDCIANGDKVVGRWRWAATHKDEFMQVPATGKRVDVTGMGIYRISGGKIAEEWVFEDILSLLQQLGAVPAPG